ATGTVFCGECLQGRLYRGKLKALRVTYPAARHCSSPASVSHVFRNVRKRSAASEGASVSAARRSSSDRYVFTFWSADLKAAASRAQARKISSTVGIEPRSSAREPFGGAWCD